jgi:hypothetical protein
MTLCTYFEVLCFSLLQDTGYSDRLYAILPSLSWKMLWKYRNQAKTASFQDIFNSSVINHPTIWYYIECSLCRLIRRPEHTIGRHWLSPGKLKVTHSVITWSVSQCYTNKSYISFYCALFCVFMTRVSHCPISLHS